MSKRVVLMPFPRAASTEHVDSTSGVNLAPEKPQEIAEVNAKITELMGYQAKYSAYRGPKDYSEQQKLLAKTIEKYQENLEAQKDIMRKAMMPQWRKIDKSDIKCADDTELSATLNSLKEDEDVLYIRGHCSIGADDLESADHQQTISYIDLVTLLDNRLGKKFSGRIKIFGCNSALASVGGRSFCYKFAEHLADKGWIKARVYGYNESLHTYINPEGSGQKMTKAGNRASSARVESGYVRAKTSCVI